MTKLLIAVKSCIQHLDMGYHDVIRQTWGKDAKALGIDVRFFVGQGLQGSRSLKYQPDEIALSCSDDYNSLPFKTKEICLWANSKVLDHIFLCDTDTFLIPKLMLQTGYEKYDYAGKINRPFGEPFPYIMVGRDGRTQLHAKALPWASGGYGYFLSKKAANVIGYNTPIGWAEDFITGQLLGNLYNTGDITMLNTPGDVYSFHFPAHIYKSGYDLRFNWMQQKYAELEGKC
jgi:hypothetical protein